MALHIAFSKLKNFLDLLAFFFTAFLLVYGFAKGYDFVELMVYNLYFATIIFSQLLHLTEMMKKL